MIEHETKELFNKRSIDKQFYIKYGNGTITNLELRQESFNLTESLCSEQELTFGCCEASSISFVVSRVFTALKNDSLDVSVVLDRNADNEFKIGKYKVYSSVPTADRKEKEVLAYDAMYDVINADVAAWYNTIFPNADSSVTLREFRSSFFDYFGIEQVEITLPNDDMVVKKTVQTDKLSGKDVVTAICEVNGCFGHINRDGLMDYVFLKERIDALYPSDDLFPAEDLYPSGNNYETFNTGNYYGCQYEDYVVKKIDALEIREQENSLGISVGDGNNRYIINGNMLLLGKTEEELTVIAQKIFDVIKHIEYRPFEATMRANLCRELGDLVRFNTKYDIFHSYILERRVTGIRNLIDTMSANGEEYRTAQVNSLQSDVLQLRGKTNVLERTIDETRSEITKKTAETLEAAKADTDEKLKEYSTTSEMRSEISQTAESINLSVDKKVTETKEYADNAATNATSNANSATDEKLKSYSTTTEMQGKIDASAEAINLSVSEQIKETKKYTDTSLEDYSTTTEMNGAISLSAQGITQEVSKKYTTKTETQNLSTRIDQTADMIAIGIDANGNLATDLTVDKNGMTFVGNYLVIDTKNFKLDSVGNAALTGNVDALSFYVKDGILMYGGGITLPTSARKIVSWDTTSIDDYKPLIIGDGRSSVEVKGALGATLYGKVECTDYTERIPIGSANNGIHDIAYITSKPKESETSSWHITVNGKWGSSEFASHNIYSGSSDVRLKENIENTKINNAIEIIEKIKVREFDWKNNGGHQKIGFVADELEEIDKSLAFGGGYEENGTPNYKTVNGFYLQGYEIKAIQELSTENRELKSEIDELKKSVSFLMEKLGGMSNE